MDENEKSIEQDIGEKGASKEEKREARRAAKKEKRMAKKAARKAIPLGKRIIAGVLKLIAVVAVLIALFAIVLSKPKVQRRLGEFLLQLGEAAFSREYPREEIIKFAPEDPEGAAEIAALPKYGKDDTWAIYVYMCGSDLEGRGKDELSYMTTLLVESETERLEDEKKEKTRAARKTFMEEITAQGMDLPNYMYLPSRQSEVTAGGIDAQSLLSILIAKVPMEGLATHDMMDITAKPLPENIKVVFQTGGSKRWEKPWSNPNRMQRFLVDESGMRMTEEKPIVNMGDRESLKDFLRYCKEYPADHQILVLWNHGGGAFGLCHDDIYNDMLSLRDVNEALASNYKADMTKPEFELIYFDACLMSTVETVKALEGYGRYYVSNEDNGFAPAPEYLGLMDALLADSSLNGAQLAKALTDTYVEHFAGPMTVEESGSSADVAMSVVDVAATAQVYDAYCSFMDARLKDAIQNPAELSKISSAAAASVRYGKNYYNVFNTIDLAVFMENLANSYPQAKKIADMVDESVLYCRSTKYLKDSRGLSVYFPADIDDAAGLEYYLEYINDICQDEATKALYYYKFAGCLNDELQAYADAKGYGKARPLDMSALSGFASSELSMAEKGNYSVKPTKEVMSLVQGYTLDLAAYDETSGKIVYYGQDKMVSYGEDGALSTDFGGKWLSLGGQPLPLDVIGETSGVVRYRVPARINGKSKHLIVAYDKNTASPQILGVCDTSNYRVADTGARGTSELKLGDKIMIAYKTNTLSSKDSGAYVTEYGKTITYKGADQLEMRTLAGGEYLSFITLKDVRGDEYYSPVVQLSVSGGVREAKVREDLTNYRD